MKKIALYSIFTFGCCFCLALVSAGCQTKSLRNSYTQKELFGRPSPTSANTEFLTNYRQELGDSNNPYDLQRWAVAITRTIPRAEKPVRIDSANIPIHGKLGKLESRSKLVGHVQTETTQELYISILTGGSGAFGWYGIKVGNPTFRPSDADFYYLEWIPGCYLYYIPP